MPALAYLALNLDPLIRRPATNHDGERLATVATLERVVIASGSSFHGLADLVAAGAKPRPSPRRATWADLLATASKLDGHPGLDPWEKDFIAGVRRTLWRGYPLSPKQRRTLAKIWDRVVEEAAA
jgi:hypothetical protein